MAPPEASRLLLAAADGHRGYVQVRDTGDQIALTDDTASLHGLDLDELRLDVPAAELVDTSSLSDAEDIIERITGISELRYETQKAARRNGSHAHPVTTADLDQVDHKAQQAADQGADYISLRRPLRTRRSRHPRRLRDTRPTPRPASARAVRTFELPRQLSITAR